MGNIINPCVHCGVKITLLFLLRPVKTNFNPSSLMIIPQPGLKPLHVFWCWLFYLSINNATQKPDKI